MSKINNAHVNKFRHGEFLQFMKNIIEACNEHQPKTLKIEAPLLKLIEATGIFDSAFIPQQADEHTALITALDERRDKALMVVKKSVEIAQLREEMNINAAANLLMTNYKSHGKRIYRLSYQQQTAVVNALLQDWESQDKLKDSVALLGIGEQVAHLKQLNLEFDETYVKRSVNTEGPAELSAKRDDMAFCYHDLIAYIAAYAKIEADNEGYTHLIDALNGVIDYYNNTAAMRLAKRNGAAKDKVH